MTMSQEHSGFSGGDLYPGAAREQRAVHTLTDISIDDPVQQRSVRFRAHVPAGDGPFPVVVFSHGSLCGCGQYDRLTLGWAQLGYLVISPEHPDALEAGPPSGPPDLMLLLSQRIRDMTLALDAVSAITGAPTGPTAIAAGHSFGALTAMIKLGLPLAPGSYQFDDSTFDERFVAGINLSGVGQLPPLAEDAFGHLTKPVLASGGSLDEGNVGAGPVFPWEWRLGAYDLAPAGGKYRLAIENADHYFGGLIARDDRGGEADADGLAMIAAVTAAFLDAYAREDAQAKRWLRETDLQALTGGRAKLEHK
jgi:hypothetical protein